MKFATTALVVVCAAVSSVIASPIQLVKRDSTFDYDTQMVRGVNLGGWFVLEPFINPSMFDQFADNTPVDEYHLTQALGKQAAEQQLSSHWNTWITQDDIKTIAGWGMNHVRIPIGYWAFAALPGDPYVQGQTAYLNRALNWIQQAGLVAWIDLHGAPGSQNGFDNSGTRDALNWQTGDNVQTTLDVIQNITATYGQHPAVAAIELVNEPLGPSLNMQQIEQYYQNGWQAVRDGGSDKVVAIHDAFQSVGYFNNFMQAPTYFNVLIDHHQYQVFSAGQLQQDIDQHIASACGIGSSYKSENLWRVTGEWSAALTDCTKWLNGVGRGARYSGSYDNSPYIGDCAGTDEPNTWSQQRLQNTRQYIEAQMDAYDQGNGWIFWTYKCENSFEWDLTRLIATGLFPQPLTDRQYPNQCGY